LKSITTFQQLILMLIPFLTLAQSAAPGNGVTDADGNFYPSIVLGNGQEWMAENLRTTKFANGADIPKAENNLVWSNTATANYADYQNNIDLSAVYGRLYNFFSTLDERNVCPAGWHVPTNIEWTKFTNEIGGLGVAGSVLKSTGTEFWSAPNTGATNTIGFNALPNGCRYDGGNYNNLGTYAFYWTATELDTTFSWYRALKYDVPTAFRNFTKKQNGYAIRCVKNQPLNLDEIHLPFIKLFPNPFTDLLEIKVSEDLKSAPQTVMVLTDGKGQKIKYIHLDNLQIDLSDLPSGLYFLFISSGNFSETLKVVKM
jgi:uncharacterized protein (TIGR02145 family)